MSVTQNRQSQTLSKEAFAKVAAESTEKALLSRPVIGYWQDALLRLSRNKIAMLSLIVIAVVGLSGVFGPVFFPSTVDGVEYQNMQDADGRNQSPSLGHKLLVTEDAPALAEDTFKEGFNLEAPLLESTNLPKIANFVYAAPATVNGVQLSWDPIEGASGYFLYRAVGGSFTDSEISNAANELDLNNIANDVNLRGYEITNIKEPNRSNYIDSSGLDPSEFYIYSIVPYVTSAESGEDVAGPVGSSVKVTLQRTVALSKAQELKPDAVVGDFVDSRPHFFGTDSLGRDIFSRMLFGTRIDFFLALLVPSLALVFGLTYGAVSGLIGGRVDMMLMRIIEIIDSLPDLLLFVLLQVALGKGVLSLIIALSAFSWTSYARTLRGEVLRLREIEFVHASRLLGASLPSLIFKHIAPNLLGVMIVLWSGHIPRIITAEAFLSIIGLGVESPMATWGTVLQEAGERFQVSPAQFFFPASVMGITLLAFFLLGDALRDAFDPKLRGRE